MESPVKNAYRMVHVDDDPALVNLKLREGAVDGWELISATACSFRRREGTIPDERLVEHIRYAMFWRKPVAGD
jgi:hypothetical protein